MSVWQILRRRASKHGDHWLRSTEIKSELPAAMVRKIDFAARTDECQKLAFFINRTDEPVPLGGVEGRVLVHTGDGLENEIAPRGVVVTRCP